MKSSLQDKEPGRPGLGLAIAGVVVAGLGLLTMGSAFPPLPKPETPVVVPRADKPMATATFHTISTEPTIRPDEVADGAILTPEADEAEPARVMAAKPHAHNGIIRASAPVTVSPPPAPAAAPPRDLAEASSVSGPKLCKAPAPEDLKAKLVQPGLILRYDAQAKPFDLPPQGPPPEEQRRLKLSALLEGMLSN